MNNAAHNSKMRKVTVWTAVAFALLWVIGSRALAQDDVPHKAVRQNSIPIIEEIPKVKRSPDLIFLEKADKLYREEGKDYIVLVGDVHFSKGGMQMYADSAHYYEQAQSFDAFGNVRMEQGDTLFIRGDELNYDGQWQIADLFCYDGRQVSLKNREVELRTEIFTYDLVEDLGYYMVGGTLSDGKNKLESIEGEYSPTTKESNFYKNVRLESIRPNDRLTLENNALYYNTATHLALFNVPTIITSKDGIIESSEGAYNTDTNLAELYRHSIVRSNRKTTLEGDTLFYDRNRGIGQAWGNMVLVDSTQQSELYGKYGFYNERTDSAFVSGRALAKEYSKGDTIYIHGGYLTSVRKINEHRRVIAVDTVWTEVVAETPSLDIAQLSDSTATDSLPTLHPLENGLAAETQIENIEVSNIENELETALVPEVDSLTATDIPQLPSRTFSLMEHTEQYVDTTHVITAWPRVRIFRDDVQGLCDSLVFTQADSVIHMHYHPIVWSDDRQIFGNTIELYVNDSTVERAVLPDFGFMAQHIEDQFYNQLTGKSMKAWFDDGELTRTLIEGSVEGIMFPEENDSTINKLVNFKTANLDGYFVNQNLKRMKMWAQTNGEAIPLYLAKYTDLHLPQFKWYEEMRPKSPDDVFVIPEEMEQLMADHPLEAPIPIPPAPDVEGMAPDEVYDE